jgi:signal peptidase I
MTYSAITSHRPTRRTSITILLLALVACALGCDDRSYSMTSTAMMPTIHSGETVVGDRSKTTPNRWDVIVLRPPHDHSTLFVFRVVGLPGETVSFDSTGTLINGTRPTRPSHLATIVYQLPRPDSPTASTLQPHPFTVPPNSYYVLGDNNGAYDSRYFGSVPQANVVATVLGK